MAFSTEGLGRCHANELLLLEARVQRRKYDDYHHKKHED